jgi:hypothetical protein
MFCLKKEIADKRRGLVVAEGPSWERLLLQQNKRCASSDPGEQLAPALLPAR